MLTYEQLLTAKDERAPLRLDARAVRVVGSPVRANGYLTVRVEDICTLVRFTDRAQHLSAAPWVLDRISR